MTNSPVIGGHRGFKGKYPENTFQGFGKCYDSGATVIETDVWVSKDNVAVISHDGSTARVFVDQDGNDTSYKIVETNYHGTLEKLKEPHSGEPLHTFRDLVEWYLNYAQGRDDLCLMLDIKRPNPPKVVKQIVQELLRAHDDISWWFPRIQLGIWDLKVIKYLNQDDYFNKVFANCGSHKGHKQFSIFHIGVDWADSVHYINYNKFIDNYTRDVAASGGKVDFKHKVTGISLLHLATVTPGFLTEFMPLLKQQKLNLYSWTVNTDEQFDHICRVAKAFSVPEYGIISDDPAYMVERKESAERAKECGVGAQKLELSYKQAAVGHVFNVFKALTGGKRVTEEELVFNSQVDENEAVDVPPNRVYQKVFQTCQRLGIF